VPQIGDILREARIHRGLTIRDVSDVTKIRARYLEALEQDDYEALPGSTFVKAYLRTYAIFLRLDPDALLDEYRLVHEPRRDDVAIRRDKRVDPSRAQAMSTQSKRKARGGRRGYFLIGALAVAIVVLLAIYGSGRGEPAATLDPDSVGGLISSTSTSDLGVSGTTEGSPTESSDGNGGSTTTIEDGSTTTTSVVVATGNDVKLVLTVSEGSCFLVVREDNEQGAELYAGTLSAGEDQTFDGSKRYWLHVGVPKVLIVNVNGVDHSLEGPPGYFVVTETSIESLP